MTRIPFERRNLVSPADGDRYEVEVCAHPNCGDPRIERHHLVRRSEIAGAHDWVWYDGVKIGNVVGLCNGHHRQITENRAAIFWSELGRFMWTEPANGTGWQDPLYPQPPMGSGEQKEHDPEAFVGAEVCPTCKRPHRKAEPKTLEQTRERRSWSIHVPADEREQGADVLDTLLEEGRKILADYGIIYDDEKKVRYHILSAMLALFVQHSKELMSST